MKDPEAIQLGISGLPIAGGAGAVSSCSGVEPGAFQSTLYAYVTKKSCASCHGTSQYPPFASPDVTTAFSVIGGVVDLANPGGSRIVAKTRDGHCGADCNTDGSAMSAQVTAWKALRDSSGCSGSGPVAEIPTPMVTVGPTQCKAVAQFQKDVRPVLANRCFGCHASNVSDFRMPTTDDGALCTSVLRHVSTATPANSQLIRKPMSGDHPKTGLTNAEVNPAWTDWIAAEK